MRVANRSDAFFRRHEPVRFATLAVFMSALAAFAVWRLVGVTRGNPRPGWLIVAFVAGVIVCSVAWVAFLGVPFREQCEGSAKRLSSGARLWLSVVVGGAAVVADEPERITPVRFWQPGWLQLIGAGFWLSLSVLILVRRTRQRAWRGLKAF
jgi:hypothetical protein